MTNYVIQISEAALMDMSVAALEGYMAVKPGQKVRKELEAYGLLWGHEILLPDEDILYAVEKMTIDSLALRRSTSVIPSNGISIIKDLLTSYWPQYSLLGDFHTHPCESLGEVTKKAGYEFSEVDRKGTLEMAAADPDFRVSLLMTIASLGRTVEKAPEYDGECIVWDFGNYRFWLTACIAGITAEGDEDDADDEAVGDFFLYPNSSEWKVQYEPEDVDDVILRCPYLLHPWAATEFGRRRGDNHVVPRMARARRR